MKTRTPQRMTGGGGGKVVVITMPDSSEVVARMPERRLACEPGKEQSGGVESGEQLHIPGGVHVMVARVRLMVAFEIAETVAIVRHQAE
jgi:hypothetical protein